MSHPNQYTLLSWHAIIIYLLSWCACVHVDMYDGLSHGAIIAIAVSCVVVLLGMALVLFGLSKKRKSSQPRSKLLIGAPVVNNLQSGYIMLQSSRDIFANFIFMFL